MTGSFAALLLAQLAPPLLPPPTLVVLLFCPPLPPDYSEPPARSPPLRSGRIPQQWTGLSSLERLVVRPGNPYLCGPVPPNLPFLLVGTIEHAAAGCRRSLWGD